MLNGFTGRDARATFLFYRGLAPLTPG